MVRASNLGPQPFRMGSVLLSYSPALLWLPFRNISLISGQETSIGLILHGKRGTPCKLASICFGASLLSSPSHAPLCSSCTKVCAFSAFSSFRLLLVQFPMLDTLPVAFPRLFIPFVSHGLSSDVTSSRYPFLTSSSATFPAHHSCLHTQRYHIKCIYFSSSLLLYAIILNNEN